MRNGLHNFSSQMAFTVLQKRAVLLSVIGPSTYKVLRSLLAPVKLSEKEYGELVAKLSQHFSPSPSEIVQRFKFHNRFCKAGESVATYVSKLRSLAEFCNFGETLEVMLLDRIVCGINDKAIGQTSRSHSRYHRISKQPAKI